MGWASGSDIAEDVWALVRKYVPKKHRKIIALNLIEIFENHDCDTMEECEQLVKDAGLEYTEEE